MPNSDPKRSLRLRASAEAFDTLRASASPTIPKAELLKHAVKSDHTPHPRVVREVYEALLDAQRAKEPPPSTLKKISGIFSRKAAAAPPPIDDVVRRFAQAFVNSD